MITQLCFPSCIMHVRISLGAQSHFLARCNSGDHYYSSKALLIHYGPGLREACIEGCCCSGLAGCKVVPVQGGNG